MKPLPFALAVVAVFSFPPATLKAGDFSLQVHAELARINAEAAAKRDTLKADQESKRAILLNERKLEEQRQEAASIAAIETDPTKAWEQQTSIKSNRIEGTLEVFAWLPSGIVLAYYGPAREGQTRDAIAVHGLPANCISGTTWKGTLYPCGEHAYKVMGGVTRKVWQYALDVPSAMRLVKSTPGGKK